MELTGTIIQDIGTESGQGKNGDWKKQTVILETEGEYPKKVACQVWNDKVTEFGLNTGDMVTASVNVESREYNGKWYTDVRIWKVEKSGHTVDQETGELNVQEDDLPF